MNLSQFSFKFLLSKKKYSYTNISLYLSILSFSFAVGATLVVISMSRGYKLQVKDALMSIEPDLMLTQRGSKYMNSFYIDSIYSLLEKNEEYNLKFSKFREEYVMLKGGGGSKGAMHIQLMEKYLTFTLQLMIII